MTRINLTELEKLAGLATQGRWKRGEVEPHRVFDMHGHVVASACSTPGQNASPFGERPKDQAAFIASANPTTILALCKALREAEGALKHAKQTMTWLSEDSQKYRGTDAGNAARSERIEIDKALTAIRAAVEI